LSLSLAVGFSVREKPDVDYLEGKADIALIGTQTIRVAQNRGICSFGDLIFPTSASNIEDPMD
jgi:tryptophan synthase alpha chain